MVEEADKVASFAWRSFNRANVYFTKDDESLPLRRFYTRTNAFVPADNLGADSSLRGLYEHTNFMPFIKDALEEEPFYRYADPLADIIINVVEAKESGEEVVFRGTLTPAFIPSRLPYKTAKQAVLLSISPICATLMTKTMTA